MLTDERKTFIKDIYDTAFYNGISYWAQLVDYNKYGLNGILLDTEEGTKHTFGYQKIEKAIEQICSDPDVSIRDDLETAIMQANKYNDASNIDAECADAIFQIAIFGEIIYG
jgi:hypothetical protein